MLDIACEVKKKHAKLSRDPMLLLDIFCPKYKQQSWFMFRIYVYLFWITIKSCKYNHHKTINKSFTKAVSLKCRVWVVSTKTFWTYKNIWNVLGITVIQIAYSNEASYQWEVLGLRKQQQVTTNWSTRLACDLGTFAKDIKLIFSYHVMYTQQGRPIILVKLSGILIHFWTKRAQNDLEETCQIYPVISEHIVVLANKSIL